MAKRKTQEEAEAFYLQKNFTLHDVYINAITPHAATCLVCMVRGTKTLNSLQQNSGCGNCYGNVKYTQEEASDVFLKVGLRLVSPYSGANIPHDCMCIAEGHLVHPTLTSALAKCGCSMCAPNAPVTQEEDDKKAIERGFIPLSPYLGSSIHRKYRCKSKGHVFPARPSNISSGFGCPKCAKEKLAEQFRFNQEEAERKYLKCGFKLKDVYVNSKTAHKSICVIEGHLVGVSLSNAQNRKRCPECFKTRRGWQELVFNRLLIKFPYLQDEVKVLKNKRFKTDIWDPINRRALELDGDYWHEQPETVESDVRKNNEYKDLKIEVLRVKYSEWKKNPEFEFEQIVRFLSS
jgi:hypothetical protein